MVERRYVLTLRKALNDLSLTAFDAGITKRSLSRTHTARGEDYKTHFDFVTHFYGSDFNPQLLSTQLQVLSTNLIVDPASNIVLSDVIEFFRTLTSAKQDLLSP